MDLPNSVIDNVNSVLFVFYVIKFKIDLLFEMMSVTECSVGLFQRFSFSQLHIHIHRSLVFLAGVVIMTKY